jgi:hypothetical protein
MFFQQKPIKKYCEVCDTWNPELSAHSCAEILAKKERDQYSSWLHPEKWEVKLRIYLKDKKWVADCDAPVVGIGDTPNDALLDFKVKERTAYGRG